MSEFVNIDHPGIPQHYHEKGYAVVKRAIPKNTAVDLRQITEREIDTCAKQLGCLKEDYLTSVSRWADPSPVTAGVSPLILEKLHEVAQKFIKKPVHLNKMNIICKNAHCTGTVPYHQDISYSPQDPYEFSMWVALNDISGDSSPLEVIPESHLLPLKPAVDFWSPHYEQDTSLKLRARKLILEAGDAVFFDSRLWHGSGTNRDLSSRYALAARWSSEDWSFSELIPPIEPDFFGLWTSGKMTEDLLAEGLSVLFRRSEADFIKLLDVWMQYLQESSLPFVIDISSALESFKNLKILHLAHIHHNGGDAIGTVYRNFWEIFLSPLKSYVSEIEMKRTLQ
jgi:ectoine hydroxylase-related dioxygenase (phytanoyl-CoA dioxygenase family)